MTYNVFFVFSSLSPKGISLLIYYISVKAFNGLDISVVFFPMADATAEYRVCERLCQTAVSGNELFGHTWGMARRWWGKASVYEDGRKTPVGYEDLEFDVVAEAIGDKNTILVGECKWKSADFADRLLAKLKAKTEKAPFSQGKNIVYVLFLKEHPLSEVDCCILYPDDVLKYQPE